MSWPKHQLPIRYFSVNYPSGISTYRFNHLVLAIIFTWHGALDFTSGYGTQGWSVQVGNIPMIFCSFFFWLFIQISQFNPVEHVSYSAFKVRMTIRQFIGIRGVMQNSVPVCQKRIYFPTILCSPLLTYSLFSNNHSYQEILLHT